MSSISLATNFEFSDHLVPNSANITARKKSSTGARKELRKALKFSQKQNVDFKEQIRIQSTEITELKKNIKQLNEIISVTSKSSQNETEVTNAASTKIVDLCRKNRQLKAELELMKSKYSKIDTKLAKLEKEITNDGESNKTNNLKTKKGSCCHIGSSVDTLQDQLSSTKQKLFDALNTNTELKNSLKLAQKCLQQEIGDNVNLNIITGANSNWRGRAQQILSLQHKIADLKERLECYQNTNSIPNDEHFRAPIRKIEANRRAELDDLQNQVKQMQITIDQQNVKISALKARNKNLVDDAMNYKLKTLNLMEQSDVNDSSIAAINEKLNIQKYHYEHEIKELHNQLADGEKLRDEMAMAQQRTNMEIEQFKSIIDSKDKEIESINQVIKRQVDEIKSICGDYLFSCRDLKKSEFLAILDSLESEKNGVIKFNEDLNIRMNKLEDKVKNQVELISKQRVKISRLEAKIKEHNKEMETQYEKKKRNQRIADYSNNLSSRLSVSGMVFENSMLNLDINQAQENAQTNDLKIDDMKNKIEFLNDKVEYMEEKMKILKKQKDDDLKCFNNIMQTSKEILLNMIKQHNNDDAVSFQYGIQNQSSTSIYKNDDLLNNDDDNDNIEADKHDMDNDSLEDYHINVNYRDTDSMTNGTIKSTAKYPTPKSSFIS